MALLKLFQVHSNFPHSLTTSCYSANFSCDWSVLKFSNVHLHLFVVATSQLQQVLMFVHIYHPFIPLVYSQSQVDPMIRGNINIMHVASVSWLLKILSFTLW